MVVLYPPLMVGVTVVFLVLGASRRSFPHGAPRREIVDALGRPTLRAPQTGRPRLSGDVMTRFLLTSLLLLGTPFAVETAPAVAADQAASVDIPAVLGTSDLARGGGTDGASWLVEVTTYEDSEVSLERALQVKARGGDALVEFVEPRKVKGQRLLTVGYNMWFTKPGLSKPVPISPRQRLAGSASNADLAATRYAEDFDATLLREEAVGSEATTSSSSRQQYVPDHVVYKVPRTAPWAKAEYYTSSGSCSSRRPSSTTTSSMTDRRTIPSAR